ncbi:MAG: MFS transporter [Acidimicrobiales bacterium]
MAARSARTATGDVAVLAAVAMVYSGALAMQVLLMPLVALASGYSKPAVGVLTAISAVAQIVIRLASAPAMRRIPDRVLVWASGVVLALSSAILAWSAILWVFVAAELLQGAARGLFWTGAQTHVVRSRRGAMGRLAAINLVGGLGMLAGPPVAGLLADSSLTTALLASSGVALVAPVLALRLHRSEPFEAVPGKMVRRLWDRPQLRMGCWAQVSAGSWRGIVNSYIPVVVKAAGESSLVVGSVVAVANAASVAGSAGAGLLRDRWTRTVLVSSVVATGIGIAFSGVTAATPVLIGLVLGVSGVGAGTLQTIGPALAATAVESAERGDAMAVSGSFRSGALLVAPLGAAGALGLAPLPGVLAMAGGAIMLPALAVRRHRRSGSRPQRGDGTGALGPTV